MDPITEIFSKGKFNLNMNLRNEYADQETLDESNALTVRTRLGYTTGVWNGFSVKGEFDNTTSLIRDANYSAPGNLNPGKTVIADPEGTAVNQAFIKYENEAFTAIFGRQRIIYDDARFIGNVVWRQHEQTYDAFSVQSTILPDTTIKYAYLDRVNRIFYDNPPQVDWESDSHIFNVSYTGLGDIGTIVGYAYLLEFANSPLNSSDSFGARFLGSQKVGESLSYNYLFEYAHQQNGDNHPVDYDANYYKLQGGLGYENWKLTVGYEVLGSDDGVQGFATPLATLFKWNGWADTFLGNPGNGLGGLTGGLRDFYVTLGTTLPGKIPVSVSYHDFSSDEGSVDYGWEIDAIMSYQISKNWKGELRYAHYDGDEGAPGGVALDRDKFWVSLNYNF